MLEAQHIHGEGELVVLADSEAALVGLVKQRNQNAFKRLYEKHLGKIYGLCLRMTGNRQMAEEATQEVFIQVWRKIGSFAGESSFSTWLHSLATNTTISYLRRQKSWLQRMSGRDDYDELAAEIEAQSEARLEDLQACLERLPERARLVFVLHAIEGYRQETIATAMGISVGTVKAQFHRAKNLIHAWLGDEPAEAANHE